MDMENSGYNFVSVSTKGFVLFCFLNHFFGLVFGMTTMPWHLRLKKKNQNYAKYFPPTVLKITSGMILN